MPGLNLYDVKIHGKTHVVAMCEEDARRAATKAGWEVQPHQPKEKCHDKLALKQENSHEQQRKEEGEGR